MNRGLYWPMLWVYSKTIQWETIALTWECSGIFGLMLHQKQQLDYFPTCLLHIILTCLSKIWRQNLLSFTSLEIGGFRSGYKQSLEMWLYMRWIKLSYTNVRIMLNQKMGHIIPSCSQYKFDGEVFEPNPFSKQFTQ